MAWTLTNADVIQALPILADHYEKADSGSTTTLVSGRLTDLIEAEIVGATIGFLTGDNAGVDATITSYTDSTGTFGFSAVSTAVDSSTGFGIVYLDYTTYINRAYDIVKNEMRNKGLDIDLFLTTSQVKELHLTKCLELICMSKRQDADTDDIYHESYLVFKQNYDGELVNLKADYDTDEDGTIEEVEEKQSNQVVLMK
ncbi:MAG: hypothetical protein HON50_00335 [Candidatus Marinimicrobia bacterium]|jgi:hypothetical protein|nr:hypothetical protein [Candidatus Neomarinimicrobiota bacterium]